MRAEIADLVQTLPGELRDCFADPAKYVVYRRNRVASANCLEQITQNFPIIARVSGRPHAAIQSLQSTFAVDHRAAFFGRTTRGQNHSRFLGRFVRKNVNRNEYGELRELLDRYP